MSIPDDQPRFPAGTEQLYQHLGHYGRIIPDVDDAYALWRYLWDAPFNDVPLSSECDAFAAAFKELTMTARELPGKVSPVRGNIVRALGTLLTNGYLREDDSEVVPMGRVRQAMRAGRFFPRFGSGKRLIIATVFGLEPVSHETEQQTELEY